MTEQTAVTATDGGAGEAPAPTATPTPQLDPAQIPGAGDTPNSDGASAITDTSGNESAGAPEQYGDFNLPENAELNGEYLTGFKEWAKGQDLSQDAAQEFIDFQAKQQTDADAAIDDAWHSLNDDWKEQVQNDPQIGGAKLEESLGMANKAISAFASGFEKEAREALDLTGAGNHPAIVKLFTNIGKAISEATTVQGRSPAQSADVPLANRLFRDMK